MVVVLLVARCAVVGFGLLRNSLTIFVSISWVGSFDDDAELAA